MSFFILFLLNLFFFFLDIALITPIYCYCIVSLRNVNQMFKLSVSTDMESAFFSFLNKKSEVICFFVWIRLMMWAKYRSDVTMCSHFESNYWGIWAIYFHFHVLSLGWRQFQVMIGAKPEEIITVQEIIKGKSMFFWYELHFNVWCPI